VNIIKEKGKLKLKRTCEIKVLSEKCDVRKLVNDIVGFLCGCNDYINESIVFDIRVVLNELIVNAIVHGNKNNTNKWIKVKIGITENGYAFFIIEDEGEGFDFKSFIEKDFEIEDTVDIKHLKESGRGVLIVKKLCDKLKFNEKGNKAVVLKKLNQD
jgi:serine/threonine-protein kinase RsbW